MKILLTGHKGFIGSNFVRYLEGHSFDTYEWGDEIPKVSNYDWVFHIGAISSTTETDVEKVMRQNYDFSCWLIDECVRHDVNLQYSSSASVYGLKTEFAESSPVDPRTPYAWSKYMTEKYCENKRHKNIIQGFRYFNVYGPGEEHKGNQASPYCQFGKQAEENGVVKVFEGSENFKRDFIHVDEVIETHMRFLRVGESGVWNVGTGTTKSFLDVAKSFNVPIQTIPMPENLKHSYQSYTCADLRKLNTTLEKYNA